MAIFGKKDETETLDIPDFVEDKSDDTKTEDSKTVDMSIFKMSDDELYDDEDENEEEEEEQPKSKKKKKGGVNVFLIVLVILFLACAVAAGLFAYKEHSAYVTAQANYQQLLANETAYKQQIAEKDNQIASLQAQLEQKQEEEANATVYTVTSDGDGARYRKGPGTSYDKTSYNGDDAVYSGEELTVLEIVDDSSLSNTKWAKVADSVYFCIEYEGEVWAKAAN